MEVYSGDFFKKVEDIENLVISVNEGKPVYIRDAASSDFISPGIGFRCAKSYDIEKLKESLNPKSEVKEEIKLKKEEPKEEPKKEAQSEEDEEPYDYGGSYDYGGGFGGDDL